MLLLLAGGAGRLTPAVGVLVVWAAAAASAACAAAVLLAVAVCCSKNLSRCSLISSAVREGLLPVVAAAGLDVEADEEEELEEEAAASFAELLQGHMMKKST